MRDAVPMKDGLPGHVEVSLASETRKRPLGPVITRATPRLSVHSVLSSSPYGSPPSRGCVILLVTWLPTAEVLPVYSLSVTGILGHNPS